MKEINVGLINLIISRKLERGFIDSSLITESEKNDLVSVGEFLSLVESSPILKTEFKIINNIEKKYIPDDQRAGRYVDENVKLFEIYTIDEVINERKKLKKFYDLDNINTKDENKIKLYESINNLIIESLSDHENIDVDKLYDSFIYVVEHIKTPKTKKEQFSNETIDLENINEAVIELAVNKFNEKYKNMSDDELKFLNELMSLNQEEKKELFESYKKEVREKLEKIEEKHLIDRKHKALDKIMIMEYNKDVVDDDIIKLYELKRGLI